MFNKDQTEKWAKRAWELDRNFAGTLSGGIDPPKHMLSCEVVGKNTVEITYDFPETGGLSDVRYHVIHPHKVRKDVFTFTDDGLLTMNGATFPGTDREADPWTADESKEFIKAFKAAFELIGGPNV